MTKKFTCVLPILIGMAVTVYAENFSDSTQTQQSSKKSNIKVTTRLHSFGMFGYAGQIANENPVADINFTYERKAWSFLIFKAVDLHAIHSDYNFTLTLLYKSFHIGKRVTFTPNFGFAIEQRFSFADHGSDAIVLLITACKLNDHLTLEHCARFGNVMIEQQEFDWLNRLRLIHSAKHIDLMMMGWHNNKVFDDTQYTTLGAGIAYSRIKVSDHVKLSTGITGLLVAETSDENNCPRKHGIQFTLAAAFD
jgi:hypothetical protein